MHPVHGKELEFVKERWEAGGLKGSGISSVYRVQNGRLYAAYMTERNRMGGGAEDEQVAANEDCLFHGADVESIRNIIRNGFDTRVASSGGALGAGNYFAHRSAYSRAYSNMQRHWTGPPPPGFGADVPGTICAYMCFLTGTSSRVSADMHPPIPIKYRSGRSLWEARDDSGARGARTHRALERREQGAEHGMRQRSLGGHLLRL